MNGDIFASRCIEHIQALQEQKAAEDGPIPTIKEKGPPKKKRKRRSNDNDDDDDDADAYDVEADSNSLILQLLGP